jgi:hypothetical protein
MLRHGFTLWFALTALLGPGVCYRALAASVGQPAHASAPADREPAPATDTAHYVAGDADVGTGSSPAPKCPPGQGKRAHALPPVSASDLAAELRLPVGVVSLPPSLVPTAPPACNQSGPASAPLPPPLAGRDLLAAYCLLRC